MNYLYNGVGPLPDIYTVYTPELQDEFPFAVMKTFGDDFLLYLCKIRPHAYFKDDGVTVRIKAIGEDGDVRSCVYYSSGQWAGEWILSTATSSYMFFDLSEFIWTSHAIYYEDGVTLCLEKSPDPVPVPAPKKGCLLNTTIHFPQNFTHNATWEKKVWNGFTKISGTAVWSDGINIYYSSGPDQYVLNGDTWEEKKWNLSHNFSGTSVWTDGTDFYLSQGDRNYILSDGVWVEKAWNVPTDWDGPTGGNIWSDGTDIYCSQYSDHHILIGDTWEKLSWDLQLFANYRGGMGGVWSDGTNVYYSHYDTHYRLNDTTWEPVTFSTKIYGDMVWTAGSNIYHSYGLLNQNNVLKNGVWKDMVWENTPTYFSGCYIWSDGTNIYYSNNEDQYVLTNSPAPVPQLSPAALMQGYQVGQAIRRMRK